MHDYDSSGGWTPDEVRRTYGLEDESNKGISAEKREEVTRETFRVFDVDKNGIIEQEEFESGWEEGRRLRDFEVSVSGNGDGGDSTGGKEAAARCGVEGARLI